MQTFIDVLRQAGASPTACAAIEAFITTDHPVPRTALIDLFKATNVAYQIEDNRIMISLLLSLLLPSCFIPDDHIDPRGSGLFMARSVLRDVQMGDANVCSTS